MRWRVISKLLGHLGHTHELGQARQLILPLQLGAGDDFRLDERPLRQAGQRQRRRRPFSGGHSAPTGQQDPPLPRPGSGDQTDASLGD